MISILQDVQQNLIFFHFRCSFFLLSFFSKISSSIESSISVTYANKREGSVTITTSHNPESPKKKDRVDVVVKGNKEEEVVESQPIITEECTELYKHIVPIIDKLTKGKVICERIEVKNNALILQVISRQGTVSIELNLHQHSKEYYKVGRGIGFRYIGEVESASLLRIADLVILSLVKYASKAIIHALKRTQERSVDIVLS